MIFLFFVTETIKCVAICSTLAQSKLVKLETIRTVILPSTVIVLWFNTLKILNKYEWKCCKGALNVKNSTDSLRNGHGWNHFHGYFSINASPKVKILRSNHEHGNRINSWSLKEVNVVNFDIKIESVSTTELKVLYKGRTHGLGSGNDY